MKSYQGVHLLAFVVAMICFVEISTQNLRDSLQGLLGGKSNEDHNQQNEEIKFNQSDVQKCFDTHIKDVYSLLKDFYHDKKGDGDIKKNESIQKYCKMTGYFIRAINDLSCAECGYYPAQHFKKQWFDIQVKNLYNDDKHQCNNKTKKEIKDCQESMEIPHSNSSETESFISSQSSTTSKSSKVAIIVVVVIVVILLILIIVWGCCSGDGDGDTKKKTGKQGAAKSGKASGKSAKSAKGGAPKSAIKQTQSNNGKKSNAGIGSKSKMSNIDSGAKSNANAKSSIGDAKSNASGSKAAAASSSSDSKA